MMMWKRRLGIVLLILLPCVGCDQLTKSVARSHLQNQETRRYLADTIRIQYAENTGAFLSLGAQLPEWFRSRFFIVVSIVAIVVLGWLLIRRRRLSVWDIVAYTLVLGGALGNLIDRLFMGGKVVDFLNLGIGTLRTGIFNVADVALMAGLGVLIVTSFFARHSKPGDAEPDAKAAA